MSLSCATAVSYTHLPYKTLGKKTYYSEEDVLTFLSNHIKEFKKEDIAFYKARIHNFFHK